MNLDHEELDRARKLIAQHGLQVSDIGSHMHVKDVRRNTATGKKEWAPVGGGYIDWKGQILALRKDGYEGTMSLETHYQRPDRDKIESTRESLAGLMSPLS